MIQNVSIQDWSGDGIVVVGTSNVQILDCDIKGVEQHAPVYAGISVNNASPIILGTR
jgi:hypothetical protein